MADYKGIKGFTIQTIAGDPPAPIVGQVWYNTTSNVLKGYVTSAGAWSSGGDMNTGKGQMGCVGGTPAALVMGGYAPNLNATEEYDGTTWTAASPLNSGRQYNAGFGSTTAAVTVGGNPAAVDATETWDGTSWATSPATLASGRQKFGTSNRSPSTAGLIFAGQNTPGPPWYSLALVESFDGSAWSVENPVNTDREAVASVGTATAALCIGGYDQNPPAAMRDEVEEYNGTTWTEKADLTTARQASACAGTTTSAVIGGGTTPPATAITEQWDGSSWTEVADLATAREGIGKGAGASGNTCIAAGADAAAPLKVLTEEWEGAPASTVTFTSS